MPANVIEGAQLAIVAPRHDQRLSREIGREKTSLLAHLIGTPNHLPRFGKDALLLEFVDS